MPHTPPAERERERESSFLVRAPAPITCLILREANDGRGARAAARAAAAAESSWLLLTREREGGGREVSERARVCACMRARLHEYACEARGNPPRTPPVTRKRGGCSGPLALPNQPKMPRADSAARGYPPAPLQSAAPTTARPGPLATKPPSLQARARDRCGGLHAACQWCMALHAPRVRLLPPSISQRARSASGGHGAHRAGKAASSCGIGRAKQTSPAGLLRGPAGEMGLGSAWATRGMVQLARRTAFEASVRTSYRGHGRRRAGANCPFGQWSNGSRGHGTTRSRKGVPRSGGSGGTIRGNIPCFPPLSLAPSFSVFSLSLKLSFTLALSLSLYLP
jgi:hypothetical protein